MNKAAKVFLILCCASVVSADGLYHMKDRYYDPETGRFTTEDSEPGDPKDPESLNRYSYGLNNPTRYTDPSGKFPIDIHGPGMIIDRPAPEHLQIPGFALIHPGPTAIVDEPPVDRLGPAGFAPETRGKTFTDDVLVVREDPAKGGVYLSGRTGKQEKLRQLAEDPNVPSRDRGWIRQDIKEIEQGKRERIRVPIGQELAHERGREAAKGYGYEHSNLQDIDLHRTQHKFDKGGRANKERPVR